MGITLMAWLRLYQLRFAEMARRKIDPQSIALSGQKDAGLDDTRGADNFNNQFQLPVLFYVAVLVAHATGQGSELFVQLAWAFVATRLVHALIQWTYNRVVHRFAVYAIGALILWWIWGVIALGLLR
ncbi:MAG: MAPEG family protein, partial [Arenimonas sp.]